MADNTDKLLEELEKWGAEPEQVLEETFLGDTAFYRECLEKFTTDTLIQTLRESLASGQMDTAIRAAHTMKGNADYLGLFPVLDAAMTVLADLRADKLEQALADMPELEAVFSEFKQHLAPYSECESENSEKE